LRAQVPPLPGRRVAVLEQPVLGTDDIVSADLAGAGKE
jgi:hypothetical protein